MYKLRWEAIMPEPTVVLLSLRLRLGYFWLPAAHKSIYAGLLVNSRRDYM